MGHTSTGASYVGFAWPKEQECGKAHLTGGGGRLKLNTVLKNIYLLSSSQEIHMELSF